MLLALCCTECPSRNPTRKSQVGLNMAIVRGEGWYSTDPLRQERPVHCTIQLKCRLISLNKHAQKMCIFTHLPLNPFTKRKFAVRIVLTVTALTRNISTWLFSESGVRLTWKSRSHIA